MANPQPRPSTEPPQADGLEVERRLLDRGRDDIRGGRWLGGDELKRWLADLVSAPSSEKPGPKA